MTPGRCAAAGLAHWGSCNAAPCWPLTQQKSVLGQAWGEGGVSLRASAGGQAASEARRGALPGGLWGLSVALRLGDPRASVRHLHVASSCRRT